MFEMGVVRRINAGTTDTAERPTAQWGRKGIAITRSGALFFIRGETGGALAASRLRIIKWRKTMKKLITALAVIASIGAMASAQAAESCASKASALEKEIRIAQQYGNTYKVAGLKKALAEVKAHCTNSSVLADAQKEVSKLEKKLAEKREDIADVQADLREAQRKGDAKKIAKYKSKLAEKQADLREIQQDLNQARAELAALKK
jgi:chromosome segregation ATPase